MVTRRQLGFGLLGTVGLVALGGAPLAWFGVDEDRVILAAVDALFPPEPGMPSGSDVAAPDALRRYLAKLPARTALEARGLLRAVELASVPWGGRFSTLDRDARTAFLAAWAESPRYPERLLVHALKQLCAVAYWQHDATWAALGYDGPLVGRVP